MQQVVLPIDGRPANVIDVPSPRPARGQVLIANRCSVISAGTEKQTIALARQSLLGKARSRPDQVRRLLEKVRQEGVATTIAQARARLAQPMPLGYASAGEVIAVGAEVNEFRVGDRVASNGPHAGVVAVGKHLVARAADNVPFDHACYAVLGAIGLHAVRLARVGLGDVAVVIGLGLIGQLTVALLKGAGCHVLATDPDSHRRAVATRMGADAVFAGDTIVEACQSRGGGHGADAVFVTAATSSSEPIALAAALARPKARVVAVGAVGLSVPRRSFYDKELELVVSCSYGPGRYDRDYETHGHDYPYGHVRWTEQRNIQAVLDQMASGRLDVSPLTTHRFPIDAAATAYAMLEAGAAAHLGVLLEYPSAAPRENRIDLAAPIIKAKRVGESKVGISVIGGGTFATSSILPELAKRRDVELRGLVSAGGLQGRVLAERFRFVFAASDAAEVLRDPDTEAVVIATRHDSHTELGLAARRAGKSVFVEKPLAMAIDDLDAWRVALADEGPLVAVGFNRRHAPGVRRLKELWAGLPGPRILSIRMNAGALPAEHWLNDPRSGGGRLIGEACHAIDTAVFLHGSPVEQVLTRVAQPAGRHGPVENAIVTLSHADGGLTSIAYLTVGDRAAGKDRIEIDAGGLTAKLDDFRRLDYSRCGRRRTERWWSAAKGYAQQWDAFLAAMKLGEPPVPHAELLHVADVTLAVSRSWRAAAPIEVAA